MGALGHPLPRLFLRDRSAGMANGIPGGYPGTQDLVQSLAQAGFRNATRLEPHYLPLGGWQPDPALKDFSARNMMCTLSWTQGADWR